MDPHRGLNIGNSRGDAARHLETIKQVIAHAHRVRDDRKTRIHGAAGWEEATIHNVEIIEIVCLAVDVQGAGLRIFSEPDRPVLMGYSGERNLLADEQTSVEQAGMAAISM